MDRPNDLYQYQGRPSGACGHRRYRRYTPTSQSIIKFVGDGRDICETRHSIHSIKYSRHPTYTPCAQQKDAPEMSGASFTHVKPRGLFFDVDHSVIHIRIIIRHDQQRPVPCFARFIAQGPGAEGRMLRIF